MTMSLTPLQKAFLALQDAEARIAELEAARTAPIAVIGLGCRAPGGVVDGASFWRLLEEGRDATGPVPADRWDHEALYDPDPETPGRISTRNGGFLGRIDAFDPEFFGITPREAAGMDPQQRMVLEVCWEALENAGQSPRGLLKLNNRGSGSGKFRPHRPQLRCPLNPHSSHTWPSIHRSMVSRCSCAISCEEDAEQAHVSLSGWASAT